MINKKASETETETLRKYCDMYLYAMLGNSELEERWWINPNKGFGGETPEKVFRDSPFTVYSYLVSRAEGEW